MKEDIALFSIIISSITLVLGVVYFVGGKLIDRYQKTQDQLELQKEKNTQHALFRLEEMLKDYKERFGITDKRFSELEKLLEQVRREVLATNQLHVELLHKVERHFHETERRLEAFGKVIMMRGKQ